jgi:hypothetical protein
LIAILLGRATLLLNLTGATNMNKRIELLVNKVDRIKDMYNVGPVQKAAIEDFVELIVKETINSAMFSNSVLRAIYFALGFSLCFFLFSAGVL